MKLHIWYMREGFGSKCDALWIGETTFSFYFRYISNQEMEAMSIIDLCTKTINSIDLTDQLRNDIVPRHCYAKGSRYNTPMFEVQRQSVVET